MQQYIYKRLGETIHIKYIKLAEIELSNYTDIINNVQGSALQIIQSGDCVMGYILR